MNIDLGIAKTHYFQFTPENNGEGVYEYCMNSKLLFDPEDAGMGVLATVEAGLEPENGSRIQIRCCSDEIIGELYLICAIDAPVPEEVRCRNRKALKVAEKLVEDMKVQGFTKEKVKIKEGEPPFIQKGLGKTVNVPLNWY